MALNMPKRWSRDYGSALAHGATHPGHRGSSLSRKIAAFFGYWIAGTMAIAISGSRMACLVIPSAVVCIAGKRDIGAYHFIILCVGVYNNRDSNLSTLKYNAIFFNDTFINISHIIS